VSNVRRGDLCLLHVATTVDFGGLLTRLVTLATLLPTTGALFKVFVLKVRSRLRDAGLPLFFASFWPASRAARTWADF
jgi:hypothetical protein